VAASIPDPLAQGEAISSWVIAEHGGVDILINNAGRSIRRAIEDSFDRFHDLERTMQLNYFGTLKVIMGLLPTMIEKKKGHIINISSIARAGNIGQSNYAASKAGVASLVVTWGKELARHGIRVMGIAPGVFATDMTAAMKPEAMARMQQAIPVGTLGQAAQLAQTVHFILANDYLSGRMIELDGGLRL